MRVRAILAFKRLLLTPLEKICLGRDLAISSWVIDGFVGLVQATTITDEEALKIDSGAETITAYKLFRIRELRITGELSSANLKTKVEEIFKEELDRLRSTEEMLLKKSQQLEFQLELVYWS